MISRYTLPAMRHIWSQESKFSKMLQIELLTIEALARAGHIPKKSCLAIKKKAPIMALYLMTKRYASGVIVILLEGGAQIDTQIVLGETTRRVQKLHPYRIEVSCKRNLLAL